MAGTLIKFQIGKNGITDGVIDSLNLSFKNHKQIRISVLKNAARDKNKVRELADELIEKLGGGYKSVIIGFTIVLRKAGRQKK